MDKFEYQLGEYLEEAYRRGRIDGNDEAGYLEDPVVDEESGDIVPYGSPCYFDDKAVKRVAAELKHIHAKQRGLI